MNAKILKIAGLVGLVVLGLLLTATLVSAMGKMTSEAPPPISTKEDRVKPNNFPPFPLRANRPYSGPNEPPGAPETPPAERQPERGQRPLPPTAAEWAAMTEAEVLGARPMGLGGGNFDVSYFFDGMENGANNWTATGLWHIADGSSNYPNAYNGTASWWYGQESTGNYDTGGGANSGYIQTGPISIPPNAKGGWLRYWSWEYTEDFGTQWDTRIVYTSTNGIDWSPIYTSSNSYAQWYEVWLPLSVSGGQDLYLRFEFDTVDGSNNGYRGWYLDDITVGYDYIQLFPAAQTGYGKPGYTVFYPWWPPGRMRIQNNTGITTTFQISTTGNWTATFPSMIGPIAPGYIYNFSGNVQIPSNAAPGTYDDTILRFTSQVSPTFVNTQTVRTWAGWVHRVDHQIIDDGSGNSWGDGDGQIDPGETFEMTVTLKNDLDRTVYGVYAYIWGNGVYNYDTWEPYGDIPAGNTTDSVGRYRYYAPTNIQPGSVVTFYVSINGRSGWWSEAFTETVPTYLDLVTDKTRANLPGNTVTYTLDLINWTGHNAPFSLTGSHNIWPTSITPTNTGIITNGTSVPVTVTVDVPAGANLGDVDVAEIHAVGLGAASAYSDTAVLTTMANCNIEGTSSVTQGDLDDIYNVNPSYVYVYVYSSDNDTLNASVMGYNSAASTWDTLAQQWSGGSGVLMDAPVASIYSLIRVQVDDWENNDWIYYGYRFIGCAQPIVALRPNVQAKGTVDDTVVTYTQSVANYTGVTTTINLAVTNSIWPTTLLSGTAVLTRTPLLPDGSTFDFSVRVEVPAGEDAGNTDTAIIQASSVTSPTLSDTARITTTVISKGWYQIYTEDYPTIPWNDSEAFLDSINSFAKWQLTDDRDGQWSTVVSAFYRDRIPYAWVRGRSNAYNYWVNEVEFGARDVNGTVVIPITRLVDHNRALDSIYDYEPAIAVDPAGGNIALVWTRRDRASETEPWQRNVYYAVYNENGQVVSPPQALTFNKDNTLQDYSPAIEAYRDGHFAVTWQHWDMTAGYSSISYAILNSDGSPVKSPTKLDIRTGYTNYWDPRLAQMLDGNMMLLWEGERVGIWTTEITYAVLNAEGDLVQDITAVTTGANTWAPDALALTNGNVMIAWENGNTSQIEYTVLDADYTTVISTTVLTNTLNNNNRNISLVEDKDGRAVFTWKDRANRHIYYALVNSNGDVVIPPVLYRQARNNWLDVNWKGYGNGGMPARPYFAIYLPLTVR